MTSDLTPLSQLAGVRINMSQIVGGGGGWSCAIAWYGGNDAYVCVGAADPNDALNKAIDKAVKREAERQAKAKPAAPPPSTDDDDEDLL